MMRNIWLFLTAVLLLAAIPAQAVELIINGDFETGDFGPAWVHGAYRGNRQDPNYADHVVLPDLPYAGNYSALLGFKYTAQRRNRYAYMYQEVDIPSNISRATLHFKIRQQGYDSDYYDPCIVDIRRTNNSILERVITQSFSEWNHKFKDSGWISDNGTPPEGHDVSGYSGQTIRIYFEQGNLWDDLYETWTYIDNVSLVYKKFVDLIVDGVGSDVFGDPGTGLGGTSAKSCLAGDTLVYQLEVENEGLVNDAYNLSINAPPGWTVWIDDGSGPAVFPYTTGTLSPSNSASYFVYVVSPAGESAGSYDLIVDAVSTTQANRYDSVTLRANITDAIYGTDLVVDDNGYGVIGPNGTGGYASKEAPTDSVLTYDIELLNTGNAPTSFVVTSSSDPAAVVSIWYDGTQYSGTFTTTVIPDGSSQTMTLTVMVPAPAPGGDYITIVNAAASQDTLKKDSIKAILRLRSPRVDMIIATSGDDIYDDTFSGLGGASSDAGERGVTVVFPIILQNESVLPDSFVLTWTRPGNGWSATITDDGVDYPFPYTTHTLPAYGETSYQLKIQIPAGASYGTYPSYVNAISITDGNISESITATISVSEPSEIDMVIDGSGVDVYGPVGTGLGGSSIQSISPGDSTVFMIEIQNISGNNSFEITWNTPLGWQVTFDGLTSPVTGHPAGTYEMKVVVPASSPGGTFDIIVDGHKTDKPFLMDSVLGRVVVVIPAAVDVVIDGDGDGIYGAPGSGLGGSSTQVTSAPAFLNYTVEIQNEGGNADQFTITWNSIPLWNALLNGSSSPHTTGVISSGGSVFRTFSVAVPPNQASGNYRYVLDIVSNADPSVTESIEAIVTVVSPPRVDLVIDGDGAGIFGLLGSGEGGTSVRGADAGSFYAAALEVRNVGSFPDSFYIEWEVPPGWPQTSMVINDGTLDHSAPFWTSVIPAAGQLDYIVKVQVPAAIDPNAHTAFINSWSSLPPNNQESVKLITQAFAVVTGFVFDDRDHDGALSAGDIGLSGVVVREDVSGLQAITAGDGAYSILMPSSVSALVIETNPSGYISLSPDSVGPFALNAGDTVRVNFADVLGLAISQGSVLNGLAGGYVDFPHVIVAGTEGHVNLTAVADSGVVTMFFLDANANGIFDGTDRLLEGADGDLDPSIGNDQLYIIFRAFVPAATPAGTTMHLGIIATQSITGTLYESQAAANDAVVVVGSAHGLLALRKEVDKPTALPGEVITYTIHVFNSGIDSVQNIVLFDPISPFVDPLPDAFGPGLDVEWSYDGAVPVYLTFNAADADECEYQSAERLLQMLFSKNGPFYLLPGQRGTFVYKARVK